MGAYKEAFSRIKGIIYHAQPEYDLANRIYDLSKVNQAVLGEDWIRILPGMPCVSESNLKSKNRLYCMQGERTREKM